MTNMGEPELRVSTAEAKRRLSELIARVAFGRVKVVITKRGKPLAALVPACEKRPHLGEATGWLEDDDPFFAVIEQIVRERGRHRARVVRRG